MITDKNFIENHPELFNNIPPPDFYTEKEHREIRDETMTAEDIERHERRLHIREDELNLRDFELMKEREDIKKEKIEIQERHNRLNEAWLCLKKVKSEVVKLVALLEDVP